jgi:hypothetical protein
MFNVLLIELLKLKGCGIEMKSPVKICVMALRRTCNGKPELKLRFIFEQTAPKN